MDTKSNTYRLFEPAHFTEAYGSRNNVHPEQDNQDDEKLGLDFGAFSDNS